MRRLILLVLYLSLFLYCGSRHQKIERYMEDGVEVVVNHIEPYKIKGEPNTLILEKEFTIDTEKEEITEVGLTDIYAYFDVDSEGSIYLGCYRHAVNKIYKFDRNGNFVTSFGRTGQGPGELQWEGLLRVMDEDKIAAIGFNHKLVIFNKDGSFIRETRFDLNTRGMIPLNNGGYLKIKFLNRPTEEYSSQQFLILCNSKFEEIKELSCLKKPRSIGRNRFEAMKAMERLLWSISNDRIFAGSTERKYEIWVYDLDGNLLRKIKKEYKPVEVPAEVKRGYLKMYERPDLEYYRKRIYFPEHMPPFQYFFNDDEGRLYVMTNKKGENAREFIYDIFNPDGIFIGRIGLDNFTKTGYGRGYSMGVKAKNNRLYCLREKESGYKELVVYKMRWE